MLRNLLNKYKSAIILLFLITLLFFSAIFLSGEDPSQQPIPVPFVKESRSEEKNVWNDLLPGTSADIEGEDVGSAEFLNQESYNDLYSVSMYKLEGPEASNVPTEVYSKKDTGVVDYIIVPVLNTSQGHLQRVIEENNLGEPDLELYVVDEFAQKMYVFLGEGLAFRANEISGGIIRRIYFTPTTAERFLEFWGGAASVEEPLFQHP